MYAVRRNSHTVSQSSVIAKFVSLLMLIGGGVSISADTPKTNDGLVECALIAESFQRLACFDRLAEQVAQASRTDAPSGAPVPQEAPGAQTDNTRSTPVASAPVTDNSTFADRKEPTSISVKLIEARRSSRDYWILTFDNGQIWRQNDSRRRALRKLPLDATISEAVMGSYTLKLAGQQWSMKVRRLR